MWLAQSHLSRQIKQAPGNLVMHHLPVKLSSVRTPSTINSSIIPLAGLKRRSLILYWQVLLYSIHMYGGSDLIHPVWLAGVRWNVGVVIGS